MLSVITALEFFQHYFAKMGHRNTSCDPHLHQAIEQPMLRTPRVASAAGRLRPNGVSGGRLLFFSSVVITWFRSAKSHFPIIPVYQELGQSLMTVSED